MKPHPSGRPIRNPQKRDYGMQTHPGIGFRCPRLNDQHIQQATDTFAMGFVDHRDSMYEYDSIEAGSESEKK